MILRTFPPHWNSVHRPIELIYDYEEQGVFIFFESGGNLVIWLNSPFVFVPVAGDKILIEGVESLSTGADVSLVNKQHTVTSVSGSLIYTSTPYAGNIAIGTVTAKFIRLPEIKLYSGYAASEEYPDDLPLTLVATFTPENSIDNDVQIDVSEYLKSTFANKIQPPIEGIDFNMFNRFRLFFDGVYHETYMVINSSIKTDELNANYVDTDRWLNKIPAIVFGCGKTILTKIQGDVVVNVFQDDAELVGADGDFNGDFNNDFLIE